MWHGARVAVIVPAYREERLIGRTIGSMPESVDQVHVVDDASEDDTAGAARAAGDARVRIWRHDVNRGVGAAIVTGYRAALAEHADVLAVMAGDAQMHPDDLPALLDPVVHGRCDYAKGNRFIHPEVRRMPLLRRAAGSALATLTRTAFAVQIDDSQCGYTAISAIALRKLDLDDLWPRFGYPNDLLGMLAREGLRIADVAVRPVYADERSGMRPWHVVSIAGLIARRWWRNRAPLALSAATSVND
jgi:glycosyltransferase involved in cell wall biosynthesis